MEYREKPDVIVNIDFFFSFRNDEQGDEENVETNLFISASTMR